MKRKIITLILLGLFLVSFSACGKKADTVNIKVTHENKVVKLGFPGNSSVLGGISGIAQEKKYFEEELAKVGYKIEYVAFPAAGPAVNQALAGNKIDFAIYADFPGVVLKSKGIDVDLLGITEDKIHSRVVVKNDSKIMSIKELRGKKIGFTKGTYMQKFLLQLLADNGLSDKDVQLINITTNGESALVGGNIDALVQTDTQALTLISTKKVAKEIENTRTHAGWSAQSVFVGSHSYVKDNPQVPVAIDKALIRAKKYFTSNTEDSYKILTKSGLNLDSVKEMYKSEAPDFKLFTINTSSESIKRLNDTQKFMIDQKLITGKFGTSKWADNSYYEKAIK
ncbi:ABC transporter substrate-binding protein [Clostridium estertheticum]|uniref:ABC transporter substrate-binding protein n=1 Tax=Clostridium estertheticum TaxID=238834 RepID=UPI001CF0EDD5|nr:ABC transporter substrate-binding protein [Clostridium estertheticum]MCB2358569.1 ABC transporter substrate-binding protein [Clostridium estertheticum]